MNRGIRASRLWSLVFASAVACGGSVVSRTGSEGDHPDAGDGGSGRSSTDGTGGRFTGSGGSSSSSGARGGTAAGAGGLGAGGLGAGGASPDVPEDVLTKPTVWIGELQHLVTSHSSLAEDTPQKLIIVLAAVTDVSSVVGTVTFGKGGPPPAPTSAGAPWPPSDVDLNDSLALDPYVGFEYSLSWSSLKGNHLTVSFVPAEVYTPWCAIQTPRPGGWAVASRRMCTCTDTTCIPITVPTRTIDVSIVGEDMTGAFASVSGDSSPPVQIRLKRVE